MNRLMCIGFVSILFISNQAKILNFRHADVIDIVSKHLPKNPVILEAGAAGGGDTLKLSKKWPQGKIYIFEPDIFNHRRLKKKILGRKNVFFYPYALSDQNGKAIFHHASNNSSGSLLKPKEHLKYSDVKFPSNFEVTTITIDTWAKENGVTHIDFLWLDLQGVELNVLMKSQSILDTVKVIYTEVELVEAYASQYLYDDLRGWLERQGFSLIGKDFDESDKKVWAGNIIMVRK